MFSPYTGEWVPLKDELGPLRGIPCIVVLLESCPGAWVLSWCLSLVLKLESCPEAWVLSWCLSLVLVLESCPEARVLSWCLSLVLKLESCPEAWVLSWSLSLVLKLESCPVLLLVLFWFLCLVLFSCCSPALFPDACDTFSYLTLRVFFRCWYLKLSSPLGLVFLLGPWSLSRSWYLILLVSFIVFLLTITVYYLELERRMFCCPEVCASFFLSSPSWFADHNSSVAGNLGLASF